MKHLDSAVWGIVVGILFTCFLMWLCSNDNEPRDCEVSISVGKETHIRYGVYVKGER